MRTGIELWFRKKTDEDEKTVKYSILRALMRKKVTKNAYLHI